MEARGDGGKSWSPVFYNDIRLSGTAQQVIPNLRQGGCFARLSVFGACNFEYHGRRSVTGTAFACLHNGVQSSKRFNLLPTFRRIGQQRHQGLGEPVRGAIPLKKFRDHVFAQYEIGKDHG